MTDTGTLRPVTPSEEAALVVRARSSREAFAPLYVRYFDRVYAYCLRRLGDPDDAADATSVIFGHAIEALATCNPESFRSWLFAIAHNTLIDHYRSRRLERPIDNEFDLPDRQPLPEDEAIRRESMRAVTDQMARLPRDQRLVLELRLSGLTSREIGEVLGKSANAVDQAQFRAVQRLRQLILTPGTAMEGPR